MLPNVFVAVLNHNRSSEAIRCVASVSASAAVRTRCVVIDNASTDDSVERLDEALGHAAVVAHGENGGYAGGMNVALETWLEGDEPYGLLLTEDMELAPAALRSLCDTMERSGQVGVLGPLILQRGEERILSAGGRIDRRRARVSQILEPEEACAYMVDWIDGCCMLLRRAAVEAVGRFDPRYFIYFEENDFCQRIRQAGWAVAVEPAARAWHERPAVQAQRYFYLMARNRYLFWRDNFGVSGWRVTAAIAMETARMTGWVMQAALNPAQRADLPRRRLYLRRQMRGVARGIRDHVRGVYGVTPAALE